MVSILFAFFKCIKCRPKFYRPEQKIAITQDDAAQSVPNYACMLTQLNMIE